MPYFLSVLCSFSECHNEAFQAFSILKSGVFDYYQDLFTSSSNSLSAKRRSCHNVCCYMPHSLEGLKHMVRYADHGLCCFCKESIWKNWPFKFAYLRVALHSYGPFPSFCRCSGAPFFVTFKDLQAIAR